jgi:hypothetical protein
VPLLGGTPFLVGIEGQAAGRAGGGVEALKVADRIIAVVQPVEPVRPKPQPPKVKTLFEG